MTFELVLLKFPNDFPLTNSLTDRKVWRTWTYKKAFIFMSFCVAGVWGHGILTIAPLTTECFSKTGHGCHGNWSHSPQYVSLHQSLFRVPDVGRSPPWRKLINLHPSEPWGGHPTKTSEIFNLLFKCWVWTKKVHNASNENFFRSMKK